MVEPQLSVHMYGNRQIKMNMVRVALVILVFGF